MVILFWKDRIVIIKAITIETKPIIPKIFTKKGNIKSVCRFAKWVETALGVKSLG